MRHDAPAVQVDAALLGRLQWPCGDSQSIDQGRRGHRDEKPGELVVGEGGR